jgi:hypothetical protein
MNISIMQLTVSSCKVTGNLGILHQQGSAMHGMQHKQQG